MLHFNFSSNLIVNLFRSVTLKFVQIVTKRIHLGITVSLIHYHSNTGLAASTIASQSTFTSHIPQYIPTRKLIKLANIIIT